MGKGTTALVMHPDCGRHDAGWAHPEHMGRLPAIVRAIERETPALHAHVEHVVADPVSEARVLQVHEPAHVARLREATARAAEGGQSVAVSGDTAVSGASWDAALAAAGCAVEAASRVARGEARNAFALTRPPGHHATAGEMMGFCLLNNVAIAARTLCAGHGAERVMIVDWDVHHGNGTQDLFYEDPGIYYLSLHQWPWYPGTGTAEERGAGAGTGTTRNVPVRAGISRDEYLASYASALDDAFAEFTPTFVLVSAGYDCLAGDPLGGLLLEPPDLHRMTVELMTRCESAASGRLAIVLEGGYEPARTGAGVVATLRALCALPE
ncbi:MAG: histone deacetylase [Gemmatimonadota bacterium]|jgi:acetoin utilization deacetylase AcuC-like enzyme